MGKKIKVPIALRVVRWWFPRLEKYVPSLATRLFVQLFFTPLHYGFPAIEMQWVKKSKRTYSIVNGRKVWEYSWGEEDKPYVLFVHGWAGRGTQFQFFFPFILEAGFRIVAFDGPAHGKSDGKQTNIAEFEEALKQLIKNRGVPRAAITHSFGGIATLMGISNGLPIRKLINIGSPSIGDEIIRTFLREVNGSWAIATFFKQYMIKKYGRSFNEFSGEYFIRKIQHLDLLLVHDENDKDVPIIHAERILELYPNAKMYRTRGLGHTRILKDEGVIKVCVQFIGQEE